MKKRRSASFPARRVAWELKWLDKKMSSAFKTTLFGIASGLIWSLIAILLRAQFLFNPDESIFVVLLVGATTGVAVSFALKVPLMKFGKTGGVILGLIALPLGIFIFGFIFALFEMIAGSPESFNGTNGFNLITAFKTALYTTFLGCIYSCYLLPLAILTTIILRKVIRPENNLSLKH
jgi:hypothetical protein